MGVIAAIRTPEVRALARHARRQSAEGMLAAYVSLAISFWVLLATRAMDMHTAGLALIAIQLLMPLVMMGVPQENRDIVRLPRALGIAQPVLRSFVARQSLAYSAGFTVASLLCYIMVWLAVGNNSPLSGSPIVQPFVGEPDNIGWGLHRTASLFAEPWWQTPTAWALLGYGAVASFTGTYAGYAYSLRRQEVSAESPGSRASRLMWLCLGLAVASVLCLFPVAIWAAHLAIQQFRQGTFGAGSR